MWECRIPKHRDCSSFEFRNKRMVDSKYIALFAFYIIINNIYGSVTSMQGTTGNKTVGTEAKTNSTNTSQVNLGKNVLDPALGIKLDLKAKTPSLNLNKASLKTLCTILKDLCQNQYDSWGK
ncbi:uncharacterized protein LOC133191429 [Saccostrea echinata]|uniref:uncharacterized protein LOC133191429 n=1 Tax=Saccostrea echinata TaxID=191078 RepID=UPI002A83FD10|nr:uncharacterized protein LOC133191429 [Saccostrea echinata]